MALSLAISGLDAGYGAVKALRGVSLHVEAGETVALLGTNGNGKSTLMKCVAGLVRPQRGSMQLTIDGTAHDLTRLSPEAIVDLGVAMVPEGRRLFPKLTVLENLMLGAFRKEARRNIDDNLAVEVNAPAVHLQNDRAARRLEQSHDALHQGALAVAVGAEQGHRLAFAHFQRYAVQRAHGAVTGLEIFYRQLNHRGRSSARRGPARFAPACLRP